jgi:hypothetical protein
MHSVWYSLTQKKSADNSADKEDNTDEPAKEI